MDFLAVHWDLYREESMYPWRVGRGDRSPSLPGTRYTKNFINAAGGELITTKV